MYKSIHTRQYATLQDLLRQERLAAGLTQAQLAQRLQWNQADISQVETGVRRLDVIELRTWLAALGLGLPAFVDRLEAELHVPTVQLTVLARQSPIPCSLQNLFKISARVDKKWFGMGCKFRITADRSNPLDCPPRRDFEQVLSQSITRNRPHPPQTRHEPLTLESCNPRLTQRAQMPSSTHHASSLHR